MGMRPLRGGRVLLLAGMTALMAVAVGIVALRAVPAGGDSSSLATVVPIRPVADPAAVPVARAGPAGDVHGMPVGYQPSFRGARAAAVGWVSGLGALMRMGPLATRDVLGELVSASSADETIEGFRVERDRFMDEFGEPPVRALWIESPLTVRIVSYDAKRAVVAVWSVLIVGVDGAEVMQLWRTHRVVVVWERGDWRVDAVSRSEGPTPPSTPGVLPSSGWEVAPMAEWTPAVLAGTSLEEEGTGRDG